MNWTAWVLQLTAIMTLGVLTQLILGPGRGRGFARFVLSLLLLSVMLTPLLDLWHHVTGSGGNWLSFLTGEAAAPQAQEPDYQAFYKSFLPGTSGT